MRLLLGLGRALFVTVDTEDDDEESDDRAEDDEVVVVEKLEDDFHEEDWEDLERTVFVIHVGSGISELEEALD